MKIISVSKNILPVIFFFGFLLVFGCSKPSDEGKIPVTTSSDEARADFLKGRDLFEKLRQQESIQYFESAIEKDKDFASAHYYHALTNPTAKGFFEDVDKMMALKDKASDGERLLILALKAGADGDQASQEKYLTELVEKYPDDERAHTALGNYYFGQQKYQMAVDELKKASEIAPQYSASYNMLGYSLRNVGNYSEAENAFKKYIELIPDDPNPYDSYAELLLKMGKYEESIAQYKKALEQNPDFFASHLGIATNYTLLKKYDEARNQCDILLNNAKNSGQKRAALFSKVISYVDEGNTDMALTEMENEYAIAKEINDAGNMSADLNAMGNILFEAGKYKEAKEKFDQSLVTVLNSNLPQEVKENTKRLNLYNEGRILLKQGDIASAKANAKNFSEQAADANNTFQIWLSHELNGMIALQEKDYQKAKDEFMQSNQQNPYTFYRLAIAYENIGNKDEAQKYLNMSKNFNGLTNINQAFVRSKTDQTISM